MEQNFNYHKGKIPGLKGGGVFGAGSENLLIHGDNLFVLPRLKHTFQGTVQCIYIDPPYNTCNEFEHFTDSLSHEEWLAMMEPRLELLWDFLSVSGSIWISIDDEECHYLKVLCDKIWGRDKFVTMIVRQKNDSPRNYKRRKIVHMQDYVLIYAKNPAQCLLREVSVNYLERYFVHDSIRDWIPDSILSKISDDKDTRFFYKIITPSGKELYPPYRRQWSVMQDEFENLYHTNQLWFGVLGDEYPCRKKYIDEVETLPPTSLWTQNMVGTNQEARVELCAFNHNEFFYVPKPEKFMQMILSIATNEGDLVLDAFLGSGTTAAVATKMNRKWIGIEKGSQCEEFCIPRLKAVIAGDSGGISSAVGWQGGSGFKYLYESETER